ncbi:putative response regulator [Bacillus sp. TS-2]|nr:putative response regulator [Bacillus sp. TS-2]
MSKFSVALVESEPAHAMLITYHIEKMGANVQLFESGKHFIDIYKNLHTDIFMISDQLDDLLIHEALNELESLPEAKRIIIMTTNHLKPYQSDKHQISYIHKPFSLREFRDSVEPLLLETHYA